MEYRIEHGACIPLRVHTVVISVQHSEDISLEDMRRELMEKVVKVRERGRREGEERGREGENITLCYIASSLDIQCTCICICKVRVRLSRIQQFSFSVLCD